MKTVREMNLLAGQHEQITAVELRQHTGDVLEQAAMGKTFAITKSGKPVATISQHESLEPLLGAEIRKLGLVGGGY